MKNLAHISRIPFLDNLDLKDYLRNNIFPVSNWFFVGKMCLFSILIFTAQPTFTQISKLIKPTEKLEIPFEYDGQFITITVRLNDGFPLNFIVDTGAENLIILKKSIADLIGCQYTQEIPIYGSDLKVVRYALVSPYVLIDIGQSHHTYSNFLIFKDDETSLDGYSGRSIDGIIGGALLSRFRVRMNFKTGIMTLYGKEFKLKNLENYQQAPLDIISNKPYMTVSVNKNGKKEDKTLLLDTGAGINGLFIIDSTEYTSNESNLIYGIIGKSINGPILGYLGKVDAIQNSIINIIEPVISYQQIDSLYLPKNFIQRDGILGNHILKNYDMIIDYSNSTLYMKQIRKSESWAFDRSGISVKAMGMNFDHYVIEYVVADSPADRAGIKKGDRIVSVQRIRATLLSLRWINKKLQKEGDKTIRMKLEREGVKHKVSFVLRDL